MADEPVPITATVCPAKLTGSCGHLPVWKVLPWKVPWPGRSGARGTERQPVAMMQNRALTRSPRSVVTVQRPVASSQTADFTLVSKAKARFRSYFSATNSA
mgnify:CR=1 FL=1